MSEDAHVEELAGPYIHSICYREFPDQASLDSHSETLQNPPCRVNEGKLLTKGFNY